MSRALAASVLWRLLTRAVDDAERRLRRLSMPEESPEPLVLDALERSVAVRWTVAALDRLAAAFRSSALMTRAAAVWEAGRRQPLDRRRLLGGTALGVATSVHLLLTIVNGAPIGWLWLILPALAGAAAVLWMAAGASSAPRTRQGSA